MAAAAASVDPIAPPADAEPLHPLEEAFHRAQADVARLNQKPGMAGVFRSRWEFLSEEQFRAICAMVKARMEWMKGEPTALYTSCMTALCFFEHQACIQVEVQRHSAELVDIHTRINAVQEECKLYFDLSPLTFREQANAVRWILDPHSYREVAVLDAQGVVTNPEALIQELRNRWLATAYCAYQMLVASRQWNGVVTRAGNVNQFLALGCIFTRGNMNIYNILHRELEQLFAFKNIMAKRLHFVKATLAIYSELYQLQARIETEFIARVGLPSMAAELVTCIGEYAFGLKVGPSESKIHAPAVPRKEDEEMQTQ